MYRCILIASLFLFSCSIESEYVGIQPYGKVDQAILDSVRTIIETSYDLKVLVLEEKELPEHAFIKTKRPRYRADSLLIHLSENQPDSIDFLLGITSRDISTTKLDSDGAIKRPEAKYLDWGIFGLGYKPGSCCVISTFRLKNSDRALYTSRVQKVAIHELGHNMGLDHCETKDCVMQDAVETITTVDTEGFELCDICLEKI